MQSLLFLSYHRFLACSWNSHKQNYRIFTFCVAYFVQYITIKVHPFITKGEIIYVSYIPRDLISALRTLTNSYILFTTLQVAPSRNSTWIVLVWVSLLLPAWTLICQLTESRRKSPTGHTQNPIRSGPSKPLTTSFARQDCPSHTNSGDSWSQLSKVSAPQN